MKVGVNLELVLSFCYSLQYRKLLLFITVPETISQAYRTGPSWKLLYRRTGVYSRPNSKEEVLYSRYTGNGRM